MNRLILFLKNTLKARAFYVPAWKNQNGTVTVANYITDGKDKIYLPELNLQKTKTQPAL